MEFFFQIRKVIQNFQRFAAVGYSIEKNVGIFQKYVMMSFSVESGTIHDFQDNVPLTEAATRQIQNLKLHCSLLIVSIATARIQNVH